MLSILLNLFRSPETDQSNSNEEEVKEANEKIAELLAQLREVGETHPDFDSKRVEHPRSARTRREGKITAVSKTGGVISRKYEFESADAGDQWKNLKVGKKVTFLLYQDEVKKVELPEDAWDENEAEDIPDEKVVDFSVDTRTVFGTIENIQDGTFIVNTGRLSPSYIVAEQFPNLKWKFESGDVLSLDCLIQDEGAYWDNNTGNILEIKDIRPFREKRGVGKISNVFYDLQLAVIDDNALMSFYICGESVKRNDRFEYEAIESPQSAKNINFEWRVITAKLRTDDREPSGQESVQSSASTSSSRSSLKFVDYSASTISRANRHDLVSGPRIASTPRFVEIRIKDYLIPEKFREVDHKMHYELVKEELEYSFPFLFQPLSDMNYVDKMHYNLHLEEIALEQAFSKYRIQRGHFERKGEYLSLAIEGIAERRPSLTIGDSIRVRDPNPCPGKKTVTYEGCIHRVEQNAILLSFAPEFYSTHNHRDYHIDFYFSRSTFKKQHFAIEKIFDVSEGLGRNFIFPLLNTQARELQVEAELGGNGQLLVAGERKDWINPNLNEYQKEAIVNILRGESRPLPYIIYGPPGTGKTATVIETIVQISANIPWSRMVVAAPSNSAANLIVERLLATGRFQRGDFVRIMAYGQIERDNIPDNIKKYCATVDIGYDDGTAPTMKESPEGLRLRMPKSVIIQHKIIISTLNGLGSLMHIRFNKEHFTHVILDEAGQSVESESMIPISFVSKNKGQVILAGDPKQLGPIVLNPVAKFTGFEKSFLERISEHQYYLPVYGPDGDCFDRRFVTKLKKNYRSIPSVLHQYNNLFYGGALQAEVNSEDSPEIQILRDLQPILWNRQKADPKCGVYFINVAKGQNSRSIESCSWCNNAEAMEVFTFLCKLRKAGFPLDDVGIITPYQLQVKNLRRLISTSLEDGGGSVKIGTVEEFQGQERKIILVSTVRSHSAYFNSDMQFGLGFLQSGKRMNVAISRARALLVVFGKESILSQDKNWHQLIQYAKSKETYVNLS